MRDDFSYDNGGRRCGWDRRQFSYTGYLPERRSGDDRRTVEDRRVALRGSDSKWWVFVSDPTGVAY